MTVQPLCERRSGHLDRTRRHPGAVPAAAAAAGAGHLATAALHQVQLSECDRIDLIANATLGDPELSWLLADANLATRPTQLAQPGLVLVIPQPAGVPGAASG